MSKNQPIPGFPPRFIIFTFFLAFFLPFIIYGERDNNTPQYLLDGSIDRNFSPVLSQHRAGFGTNQIQSLPDGKMLVAGSFKVVNGVIKTNLAKIDENGNLDPAFGVTLVSTNSIYPDSIIRKVIVQTDGKIIIGGTFNLVNGLSANSIARLNTDGTIDSTFNSGTGFNNYVTALTLDENGKILVGGNFSAVNGFSRSNLARLNGNGSVDTSFSPVIGTSFTEPITSIVPLPDGKIFIQGRFNQVNSALRRGLARLNNDGSLDASFVEPGSYTLFNGMNDFAIRPDGKIYIGGFFEIRVNNQLVCQNLCLLNANGVLDSSYFVSFGTNSSVRTINLLEDGRLLIYGTFQTINGQTRNGVTKLFENGTIDNTFNPSFDLGNGVLTSLTKLPDGRFVLTGSFTAINGSNLENLARIDSLGNLDTNFAPSFAQFGTGLTSAGQNDGKILIAGDFNRVNGQPKGRIARLNQDDSLDNSFHSSVTSSQPANIGFNDVNKILVQSDGKIIIGGTFARVNGESRSYLARLNTNGTLDSGFNPLLTYEGSGGGSIQSIALQSDQKIIIGGAFQTVNGAARINYAKLNQDGTLDSAFSIPFNSAFAPAVYAILIQPDGKILIGGNFRFDGNTNTLNVARLNTNGSLDSAFILPTSQVSTPYLVRTITLREDGKILVGGGWDSSNRPLISRLMTDGTIDPGFNAGRIGIGFNSDQIHSINIRPNGKIIISGSFSNINNQPRANVARLLENGRLDYSFNSLNSRPTYSPATPTSDGSLIFTGFFNQFSNEPKTGVVKLNIKDLARTPIFDYDGDGRDDVSVFRPSNGSWYLQRSTNGFAASQFGISTDKIVPTDFDGDGRTDLSVFRDGNWYWINSSTNSFASIQFGIAGDMPVPADYDGDSRNDIAVYRQGIWYILQSRLGFSAVSFGVSTDKPIVGDYDGDGRADQAVYRPAEGYWYLNTSSQGVKAINFGIAADKPVSADYDGDRKTDIAVYRDGYWYRLNSSNNQFVAVQFGIATDLPVPADYDGDGRADVAVYRAGYWYLLQSTDGFAAIAFGQSGDQPVENAFIY